MIFAVILGLFIVLYKSGRVLRGAAPVSAEDGWENENWFAGFTLLTAPLFFSALCEVKYFWWFLLVTVLLCSHKYIFPGNFVTGAFVVYILWAVLGLLLGGHWIRGSLIIIKYILILFFFLIGMHVQVTQKNILRIFKYAMAGAFGSFCLAGGVTAFFFLPIYLFSTHFIFSFAGLSDYFAAISPVCLGLFFWTREYKYLILWGGLFLSSVLFVVRTGIGGFIVAAIAFFLMRYRLKSLPIILLLIVILGASVFYVEPVRNKMFVPEVVARLEAEGPGIYLLARENVKTTGRSYLKDLVLETFPLEDNWIGYGSGATNQQLRVWAELLRVAPILHNDYLTILVDHGILGLLYWSGLMISILGIIWHITGSAQCSDLVKLLGQVAAGSLAGVSFAMGFDNVISHIMSSIGIAFLLLGMFWRGVEQERALVYDKRRAQHNNFQDHQ